MAYGLSVDVGTSFTAAAIIRCDGSGEHAPQVLALGVRSAAIPSVIFIGEDGHSVVGEAAERRGVTQPERVAREFKRRVGDAVPLVIGESSVLPEELFATMVRWVVDLAQEREGEPPSSITLTHPAGWGEYRISLIRRALADVGIDEPVLLTEPEAAALSYASQQRVPVGSTLAVYDLGGGTFDATILRKSDDDSFVELATPVGIDRLGGADFDQLVFDHVVENSAAAFSTLDPESAEILPALARLRKECSEAKEALSTDSDATIPVLLPGAHTEVRLVRSEFEAMVEPELRRTIEVLRASLDDAGVESKDLSAILLIGGSSRIPLVTQLLSAEFERPLAIDVDPKASIALGAAFASAVLSDDDAAAAAAGISADHPAPAHATNVSGFSTPTTGRPGAFAPHHTPTHSRSNSRLTVRVGAVLAAVALLGVATASATNAPSPLAVLSAIAGSGEQRAEAAEPRVGSTGSSSPTAGIGGAEGDAGTEGAEDPATFFDRAVESAAASATAAPSKDAGDDADDDAGDDTDDAPGSTATSRAGSAAGESAADKDRAKDAGAKAEPESSGASAGTKPTTAPPSGGSSTPGTSKPGTSPTTPAPPSPFPTPTTQPPMTQPPVTTPPVTQPVPSSTPPSDPSPVVLAQPVDPPSPDPTPDTPPPAPSQPAEPSPEPEASSSPPETEAPPAPTPSSTEPSAISEG